jgi:hypothetical protein
MSIIKTHWTGRVVVICFRKSNEQLKSDNKSVKVFSFVNNGAISKKQISRKIN